MLSTKNFTFQILPQLLNVILYLRLNFVKTTWHPWNFFLLFLWRIWTRGRCWHVAKIEMDFMNGPFGGGQCNLSYQTNKAESQQSWHRRLGHPYKRVLKTLLHKFSIPVSKLEKFDYCNSCSSNKKSLATFISEYFTVQKPLQTVFSDLWGASPVFRLIKNYIM